LAGWYSSVADSTNSNYTASSYFRRLYKCSLYRRFWNWADLAFKKEKSRWSANLFSPPSTDDQTDLFCRFWFFLGNWQYRPFETDSKRFFCTTYLLNVIAWLCFHRSHHNTYSLSLTSSEGTHLYLASACLYHYISFSKKNTYAWLHILAACYEASKKSRGTPNHMSLISTVAFKANSFQPRKKNR
jgi:hypothetical protein